MWRTLKALRVETVLGIDASESCAANSSQAVMKKAKAHREERERKMVASRVIGLCLGRGEELFDSFKDDPTIEDRVDQVGFIVGDFKRVQLVEQVLERDGAHQLDAEVRSDSDGR